jgi:hypothetical protein
VLPLPFVQIPEYGFKLITPPVILNPMSDTWHKDNVKDFTFPNFAQIIIFWQKTHIFVEYVLNSNQT